MIPSAESVRNCSLVIGGSPPPGIANAKRGRHGSASRRLVSFRADCTKGARGDYPSDRLVPWSEQR